MAEVGLQRPGVGAVCTKNLAQDARLPDCDGLPGEGWFPVPLPLPPSRRERLSVAILPREYARNLQHPETDPCTLERG
jgi:hypothetical protein